MSSNFENKEMIRVESLTKIFRNNKATQKLIEKNNSKDEIREKTGAIVALQDVNFSVNKGEIFCIIGLSGSGKSTLVRCLNALLKPTSGKIHVNGIDVFSQSKKEMLEFRRNHVSMVFQHFGLMSHRDVIGNVSYGLEIKGLEKEARLAKAKEMIEMVGLDGFEYEKISNLSGGMKQRVGIARALSCATEILLMDEPFSALDPLVRKEMQFELLKIQKKLNKTVVFITHDMDEAFKLGNRIAIMQDGKVIQIATPEEMCENPANDYVRSFVENTDKTKIFSAKHIMINPTCMVRAEGFPNVALREMKNAQVSSAYVVDDKMRLQGILTLEDTIKAKNENLNIKDIMMEADSVSMDTFIADLIEVMTKAKYPLAVVDDEGQLHGILTKVSVLSLLK